MSPPQTDKKGYFKRLKSYIENPDSSQFFILGVFFLVGGLITILAFYFSLQKGVLNEQVRFIEYRNVELSDHPIVKRENVDGFSEVTIFIRTQEPANSNIAAVVYGIQKNGDIREIRSIQNISSTWINWKQQISYSSVEVIIKPELQGNGSLTLPVNSGVSNNNPETSPDASSPKTPVGVKFDLLVYLYPKNQP